MVMTGEERKVFDWGRVVDYSARYARPLPDTQYELPGITEELHAAPCAADDGHDGVPVAVVPLWHAMVRPAARAARVQAGPPGGPAPSGGRPGPSRGSTPSLRPALSQVAWGLPYFGRYLPEVLVAEHIPRSARIGRDGEAALVEAVRFPRDPQTS